jgi:hypothetical protein
MMFEHDLKSHLQAGAGVSALVADRIFPLRLKDGGALPAVTYQVIYGATANSLDGFTSGMVNYQVQLDCWSETYEGALSLAKAVRDRMNTAATAFSAVIRDFPGNDDYEPDTKHYRRILNVSCWHHE